MRYNSWLVKEYINLFKVTTGVEKLETNENQFISDFFDTSLDSSSKIIYYNAIYRYKRGYPKFIILFFIKRAFKKEFKLQKAPKSLIKTSDIFAEKMLFNAMKFYCRISDL